MDWVSLVRTGAYIGGGALAYVAARRVYDDWFLRVTKSRTAQIKLNAYQQREAIKSLMHIPSDERGRLGTVVRPDGSIVNMDTHARFDDQWRVTYIDPLKERVDALERLMLAAPHGNGSGNTVQELLPDPGPALPEFITPEQVMSASPSYHRLVLGRTEHETITADMADLVHVAVGGSSGWGKSVFLRWMVYQLISSTDEVHLALIDLEGVTLAPFARSNRVLWPMADTEPDAVIILNQLVSELDRRKELFGKYEGVDSLYGYNQRATEEGGDPLVPIVTVVDETPGLLEDKRVEGGLRTLATRARKYGLWLLMAGQDWKSTTLDTAIRNQLGARIHFRAMSASQAHVLMKVTGPGPETFKVKGRAMAVLPGQDPVVFQTPMVKYSDVRGLNGNGPMNPMPTQGEKELEWTVEYARTIYDELAEKTKSEMCRRIWQDMGKEPPAPTGGSHWGKVDQLWKSAGLPE